MVKTKINMNMPQLDPLIDSADQLFNIIYQLCYSFSQIKLVKLGIRAVFLVFLLSFYSVINSVDRFSEQLFIPLKLLFKIVCYICTFSLSFLVVTVLV